MKVIFSCNFPFALAHGGVQTQLEAIMRELPALGVTVEPERWWDAQQTGDVLQYFGRPPSVQHVRLVGGNFPERRTPIGRMLVRWFELS